MRSCCLGMLTPDLPKKDRILVIKLSALGDFVQAMGPFAAIRAHHPAAHLTLLTTRPYAALAQASPYFDTVWIDARPRWWNWPVWLKQRQLWRGTRFDMVYDLQTSDRSSSYYRLMERPRWSGIARGCSHPHANPQRDFMHTLDRQAEQLAMAGIAVTPAPDLAWVRSDMTRYALPARYALLVPGGAAHRPAKRWPASHYASLAGALVQAGVTPVLLGTASEGAVLDAIHAACPQALALTGQTSFAEIITLARHAVVALGNDTGPMHLIAAANCPSVVLFSDASNPDLCAPRGRVTLLQVSDLTMLDVASVWEAVCTVLASP